jgi:hypothetical protein
MEPDVKSRNVLIEIPGTDKADEFVIIGGHIDSWGNHTYLCTLLILIVI